MSITYRNYICLIVLLFFSIANAEAAMRCGPHLIMEGALTMEVKRKCGEPKEKDVRTPPVILDKNSEAATVEIWVYGPTNGVYKYLRFIDGRLVKIWSERE
ncbi:MAG: DUF2845 domain-containing protein [Pseudomonadota bacterium]|nr:DUF2845 domain-containing protein [Pseudomonadota bacterium]